ncbi:MAG: calcium/sodium antiporter [Trueperaceae bacterium]|nr:calcium/sodium antiporter [Trueperaceae bacterium]
MSILYLILGIALLYAGGEFLVRHASLLASRFGISSLVIGLTVVAFGTSAPELAATLASALDGAPDLAIGNVIGSNIANVALILGIAALIYPVSAGKLFLKRDFPVMMAVSLLLIPFMLDGVVSRLEGGILVGLLIAYLVYLLKYDQSQLAADDLPSEPKGPVWQNIVLLILGIGLLIAGARLLVIGAIAIATRLGVPEAVIGLTVVAFGTSLPELASSVIAASKKQSDILLGNVIGSNIFNVLAILGITALVKPLAEPFAAIRLDILIMLGFSLALLPLFIVGTRGRLGRVPGGLLFAAYLTYIVLLFT